MTRLTTPLRSYHRRRLDAPTFGGFIVGACATLAGASIRMPVVGFDGYDVLTIIMSIGLIAASMRRPINVSPATAAAVCGLLAIAIALPDGQHFVVRSALLVTATAAIACGAVRTAAVVNGFILGATVHAVLALQGYFSSGGPRSDDKTFEALRDWRRSFDWLAGPNENPPRIAQGFLRMEGLLGHANEFGGLMAGTAIVAMTSKLDPRLRIALTALFLSCTVLSLSRFAIVIGFVGVAILLRRSYRLTTRRYRIIAIVMSVPVLAFVALPLADRLLNVFDSENISGRAASGGGLESLDFLPDGVAGTWHSSPLWMVDLAGVFLGAAWVMLMCGTLLALGRRLRSSFSTVVLIALGTLFLTEDRIQSPSFLALTLVSFASFARTQRTGQQIAVAPP